MAIARRGMLKAMLAVLLGGSIGAGRCVKRVRGVVEARRGRRYPGPVVPFDADAARRPGRWLG